MILPLLYLVFKKVPKLSDIFDLQSPPSPLKEFDKLLVRLRIYRMGKNLTQNEVAKKLDMSLRTFQRIEQGLAPLEVQVLHHLSKILEVPYEQLAGPYYTKKDLENVDFYSDLESIPESFLITETTKSEFLNLKESLFNSLEDRTLTITNLHKLPLFKNNSRAYYYSDQKWTWLNKVARGKDKQRPKGRISVMKNLSDFEFIVKLWEVCYESEEKYYICKTFHDLPGKGKMEAITLNYFHPYQGMPFTIGSILGLLPVD